MLKLHHWFQQLSTAGKLLLLLSAAILPLGLVLIYAATSGINQANNALQARATDQGRLAMRAVDSLISRNVLALRVAANSALTGPAPCLSVARAMSLSPNVPTSFVLRDSLGTELCAFGGANARERPTLLVPPGQVRLWISEAGNTLHYRVGTYRGTATGSIDREQLRSALVAARVETGTFTLSDGDEEIRVAGRAAPQPSSPGLDHSTLTVEHPIASGQLSATAIVSTERVRSADRLIILLPVAMWIVAALLSWVVVRTFLLSPLRKMSRAIAAHEPGSGALALPGRLGSAVEIRELGASFARAVERIERSEKEMAEALEGQRRLVREVHHRVKNNLQVVASLLNIHRRSATSDDAKDAYSSIGRRVDALAVVHRNHYAELEENRGIALRPLISELAANLRGSAPDSARSLDIELDLESLNTTQDVAVATAFLVTEIVEHAMLTKPDAPVMLTLRRTGDHTARFTLATGALSDSASAEHQQFERIVAGLAKQLRSGLDKAPGRYSVDLPVFPGR